MRQTNDIDAITIKPTNILADQDFQQRGSITITVILELTPKIL